MFRDSQNEQEVFSCTALNILPLSWRLFSMG